MSKGIELPPPTHPHPREARLQIACLLLGVGPHMPGTDARPSCGTSAAHTSRDLGFWSQRLPSMHCWLGQWGPHIQSLQAEGTWPKKTSVALPPSPSPQPGVRCRARAAVCKSQAPCADWLLAGLPVRQAGLRCGDPALQPPGTALRAPRHGRRRRWGHSQPSPHTGAPVATCTSQGTTPLSGSHQFGARAPDAARRPNDHHLPDCGNKARSKSVSTKAFIMQKSKASANGV